MKIDANVEVFAAGGSKVLDTLVVPVDMDYVNGDEEDANEWIEHSTTWMDTSEKWQKAGVMAVFEVTNMQNIIDELKFGEFSSKTN